MTTPPSGTPNIAAEKTSFTTAPGNEAEVVFTLTNPAGAPEFYQVAVLGIPPSWVSTREPVVQVPAGQGIRVVISIRPPASSQTHAGRIPFSIRVTSQRDAALTTELRCVLTVAAIQVDGPIGILLPAPQYSVTPGESVMIPVVVINQGLVEDLFTLDVDGIPGNWLTQGAAAPSARLRPREQKELTLQVKPPRSPQSRAGRHTLILKASGAQDPSQVVEARVALVVAPFHQFRARLEPERVTETQPARVSIGNLGNLPETFTLLCQSPDGKVVFEPAQMQEVRVNPGEAHSAQFTARSAQPHLIGGQYISPYKVQVRASDKQSISLSGELVSHGLVPPLLMPFFVLFCAAFVCAAVFIVMNGFNTNNQTARASQTAQAMLVQIISATQTAIAAGSTPVVGLDSDGDGLPDAQEAAFGTDPHKADTDGDTLTDKTEIELRTDPLKVDTDADGLSDGEEVRLAINPLNPDSDGDKLNDAEELRLGANPLNSDSDNDKLIDGDEISHSTNPLVPDEDGDALLDGDEIRLGANPKNPDTDSDRLPDGQEVKLGTSPTNPDSDGDGIIDSADSDPSNTITVTVTATPTATPTSTLTPTPTSTSTPTPIAATATATTTATRTTPPAPPPSTATATSTLVVPALPGSLAYESNREGNPEIYAHNPANSTAFRLTVSQGVDTQPAWSPDRTQVLFTTNRDGNNEVYLMNADGSFPVNLTSNQADDQYPAWSSDGEWIVFTSNRTGNQDIYKMRSTGEELTNLTNTPGDDFQPSWFTIKRFFSSEDKIVFTSNRTGNNEIFIMKTDGSDQTNLSHNTANDFYPAGSPQGDRIAFSSNRSGNLEVYLMNTDGTAIFNLSNDGGEDINPSWAPDARWIAFITNRNGNQEVYIMRSDGAQQTNFSVNAATDLYVNWR